MRPFLVYLEGGYFASIAADFCCEISKTTSGLVYRKDNLLSIFLCPHQLYPS